VVLGIFTGLIQLRFLPVGTGKRVVWSVFMAAGWALGLSLGWIVGVAAHVLVLGPIGCVSGLVFGVFTSIYLLPDLRRWADAPEA
jgi:hypothetical protein